MENELQESRVKVTAVDIGVVVLGPEESETESRVTQGVYEAGRQ